MKKRAPLVGLCPIGKFVFSHKDACRQKRIIQQKLREWDVRYVDLERVLPDGMVRDQAHVDTVVRYFRSKDIDALFMPHCNFGTEGAVGEIGRQLGLPVLLWGPRDEMPEADGTRLRDTLCGLFASSKVLRKLEVAFTYIENCRSDDPLLRAGVDRFLRAVNAAAAVRRGIRIGHIGQRIDFFWTTIVNESELLEKFRVQVQPIDMVAFIGRVKDRARVNGANYRREARRWRRQIAMEGFTDEGPMMRILAARDVMMECIHDYSLDALAVQDFPSLVDALGTYAFFANSLVGNECPVALESDIHGAVSLVLLHRTMFGVEPVFLADVTARHPEDDNGVLLWHAGAPTELKRDGERIRLGRHWILPSPVAGMPHFGLKGGPITIARFDGDSGYYRLAVGEGASMSGPFTQNSYVWMKVDDWSRWERILIEGPFIHHVAMGYAHCGDALIEACRFIPGLTPVHLNGGGASRRV